MQDNHDYADDNAAEGLAKLVDFERDTFLLYENDVRIYFDNDYYKSQLDYNSAIDHQDLFYHYIDTGWKLGLDPSPYFDTDFYLSRSPDVVSANLNPLFHYAIWGIKEGREPHAENKQIEDKHGKDHNIDVIRANFDEEYYISMHPEIKNNHVDAVRHYMHFGWRLGYDPTPLFSTNYYLQNNDDVRHSNINPYLHYIKWGKLEGRQGLPSPHPIESFFYGVSDIQEKLIKEKIDKEYYFHQGENALSQNIDPAKHYLHFGSRMGLNPSADFETEYYIKTHPHVDFEVNNPLFHYWTQGLSHGSIPSRIHKVFTTDNFRERELIAANIVEEYFDKQYYLERYSDIKNNNIDPIKHYIVAGYKEGRDPNPWFSSSFYNAKYPDFRLYGVDPLTHYLLWGKKNNFQTTDAKYISHAAIDENATIIGDTMISGTSSILESNIQDVKPDFTYDADHLDIHWLIPNFAKGGGGHMTIFRMIHWLEYFGHKCTIWIQDKDELCLQERYEKILLFYQFIKGDVRQFSEDFYNTSADAVIATSWDTAYHVDRTLGFKRKFYFVQDFEPYFYARGSRSLLAEQTYDMKLDCLCASPWLADCVRKYGRWAVPFWLAYDHEAYFEKEKPRNCVPRIAFYGRGYSERRCVEIGLMALQELHARGLKFEVDVFGTTHKFEKSPFPLRSHGVLDPTQLGDLYRVCDIGVCFSATNYSLVPQEMMACGLPIIEIDVESTRAIFPPDVVTLCRPNPSNVADGICNLLNSEELRTNQMAAAAMWVKKHSWEAAARIVSDAIRERIGSHSWQAVPSPYVKNLQHAVKASIIIPTLNGGKLFQQVVEQIKAQKTNWEYELIVVDSGSTDGTVEFVRNTSIARCITINKREFQHGRTRNFGIEESAGEFALILTQDALPSDEFWLYNMVSTLEKFEIAAGAFGKHIAWPSSSFYTRRDIDKHFKGFERFPLLVSKFLDMQKWNAKDQNFRQMLRFYSDNNSCMRKSIWREIPYPEVEYGEDQAWASEIIKRGYGKVYAPNATVYHSHDYTPQEAMERARVESWFFNTMFGENLAKYDVVTEIDARNADAERTGYAAGLSRVEIDRKRSLNVAEVIGSVSGLYGAH